MNRAVIFTREIAAFMVWPQDERKRMTEMKDAIVDAAIANFEEFSANGKAEVAKQAVNATPPAARFEAAKRNIEFGFLAGQILYRALNAKKDGSGYQLNNLKSTLAAEWDFSVSTVENSIWKNFRPVAPLWASTIQFCKWYGEFILPCKSSDISEFVDTAKGLACVAQEEGLWDEYPLLLTELLADAGNYKSV